MCAAPALRRGAGRKPGVKANVQAATETTGNIETERLPFFFFSPPTTTRTPAIAGSQEWAGTKPEAG